MPRWTLVVLLSLGCPAAGFAETTGERAGDILSVALPLAALGMTFYERDREGRLQLARSIGVNTLATLALKEAVDKRRPDGECCDAFPSGHASTSFVSAAFMHRRYGLRRALPAYALSVYVGYSRVDADKHAVEDVLAGAALGFVSGWFLARRYGNAQVTPIVQRDFLGLQVRGRF